MRDKKRQGVAIIEFSFVMVVLVPLLLGTVGIGLRLVQALRTQQLARDSGRMYARDLDFSQPGNKTILATLGAEVGLQTDGTGNSVLVLTTVTYIDKGMCQLDGYALDGAGDPIGCPNWKSWAFAQRLIIGNSSIRTSNLGSPLVTGPNPVTVNSTTGKISIHDQVSNRGDQAVFAMGNPFVNTTSQELNTLPTGQVLYVTEVAVTGFRLPPFATGDVVYAYNVF
jgi:hypothetical protein